MSVEAYSAVGAFLVSVSARSCQPSMSQIDRETQAFVEQQSKRMMSFAMYRRLKTVVDLWVHDERGKARVAAGALYGLIVLLAVLVLSAFVFPTYGALALVIGFPAWIVLVVILIRKHLGAPR